MRLPDGLHEDLREFYKTSPMREGILCWYPFEPDSSVLDLSGGVLTELLQRHCGLDPQSPEINGGLQLGGRNDGLTEGLNGKFDYIVVLDPEDFSIEMLAGYKNRLNGHGRLLLAYENPFALRYWSGKPAPETGRPYDSLSSTTYVSSKTTKPPQICSANITGDANITGNANITGRPGKAQLRCNLKLAGFAKQKWYYPLTDHWFTREVYSENYLPDEFFNNRFKPYIADYDTLTFDERELYRETVRGGAFEFMCGAYLVEARVCGNDMPCAVDYAAVTAYREPAHRFATTVCSDGKVYKIPLHPDGIRSLQKTYDNHNELAGSGVSVIPATLQASSLTMKRLNLPTLWDYWVAKLSAGTFDEEEMYRQFDYIHDAIYKASQATGKCFWELVPANCFYDKQKDELTFFDQEHCSAGDSPDIAMARALWALIYPSAFSNDSRTQTWLENLKNRYGLAAEWDELCAKVNEKTSKALGTHAAELVAMTNRAIRRFR